ncbi:putative peptidase family-domain-containing protein [Lipomyces tetrasporus]
MRVTLPLLILAASSAHAAPFMAVNNGGVKAWDSGAVNDYIIHVSCNATEVHQLRKGLADAITLAAHARDHVLRWGNASEIYRRYFGNAASGEVVGNLEKIVSADKGSVLFRCDNPDGNCDIEGWAGHWRGANATGETVICPLSFTTRRYLEQICAFGFTVSGSKPNELFGSDLIHRLYHTPAIGEGHVEHFADSYEDVLELGKHNSTFAVRDSNTLQYFALDAYAYDIAVPGIGCAGNIIKSSPEQQRTTTSSQTSSLRPSTSTAPSSTVTQPPSSTFEVPEGCHTHEGGELHCA